MKILILALLLMGCASSGVYTPREQGTVLVRYWGIGSIVVRLSNGQRLGWVQSGHDECLRVFYKNTYQLIARAVGSDLTIITPPIDFRTYPHWVWDINDNRITSSMNIVPVQNSCKEVNDEPVSNNPP